jgi:hypothetical protein
MRDTTAAIRSFIRGLKTCSTSGAVFVEHGDGAAWFAALAVLVDGMPDDEIESVVEIGLRTGNGRGTA